jgi:hypothetical protein
MESTEVKIKMFNEIFELKYENYTFYAHNLSSFDALFIINALVIGKFKIKPTIKDGNFICLIVEKHIEQINSKGKKSKKN